MSDQLDRIEAIARVPESGRLHQADVLALVEIARAAQEMADGDQTLSFRLRAALARLNTQEGT